MAEFAASVSTYVALLTLLAAAVGHVRRPDEVPAALRAHGVVPEAAAGPIGFAVAAVEVALSVALLAGVLGSNGLLVAGLAGSVVMFAGFAGYGWLVVATGRSGPCGCAGADTPMNGWTAGRAAALAALAACGLAWSGSVTTLVDPGGRLAVVLLAAGTFATLLWFLPAAMRDQTRDLGYDREAVR